MVLKDLVETKGDGKENDDVDDDEQDEQDRLYRYKLKRNEIVGFKMPTCGKTEIFTLETFEGIGKALCISILDITELNPKSRIKNTPFKSLENVRL